MFCSALTSDKMRFLLKSLIYALVAQLDRALDSDSKGRWFESSQARHKRETKKMSCGKALIYQGFSAFLAEDFLI